MPIGRASKPSVLLSARNKKSAGQVRRPLSLIQWSAFYLQIEAIEVHHLDPGRDKVLEELVGAILAGIDLAQRPQLGIGTQHQIHTRSGPLDLAGLAVAALEYIARERLPLQPHIEQVAEEVIGQRF